MTQYIAHRKETANIEDRSLLEHLQGTAALAAKYAAGFGAEEPGRSCGLAHDLGKYSKDFQARIQGKSLIDFTMQA